MWSFTKKKRRGRKVFGFLCDPKLAVGVKLMAYGLQVPIYPLAEHLLQVGLAQIIPMLENPEQRERLQKHLLTGHLLVSELAGEVNSKNWTTGQGRTLLQERDKP